MKNTNTFEIGTKVRVTRVDLSTKRLQDWVNESCPEFDAKEVFDYDETLNFTGTVCGFSSDNSVVFVLLDGWNERDICFFRDELEVIG